MRLEHLKPYNYVWIVYIICHITVYKQMIIIEK